MHHVPARRQLSQSTLSRLSSRYVELLEPRRYLSGEGYLVTGDASVDEGSAYAIVLHAPEGQTPDAWTVDWGDGRVETFDGEVVTAEHVYANGTMTFPIGVDVVVGETSTPAAVHIGPTGRVDRAFYNNARVASYPDTGGRVAYQEDGRIVLSGASSGKLAVWRRLPDGTADTNWGIDGLATADLLTDQGGYADVAVMPDGRVVAAAVDYATEPELIQVARFLPDGTLDASFGGDGTVSHALSDTTFQIDLAVRPSGEVLIAGRGFGVWQLTADGTIDESFGNGGHAQHRFPNAAPGYSAFNTDVLVQDDAKLVLGAKVTVDSPSSSGAIYSDRFGLTRYLPDGTLDTTFGTRGFTVTDVPGEWDEVAALAFDAEGRILAAGDSAIGTVSGSDFGQLVVARYSADGLLDMSFGIGGLFVHNPGTEDDLSHDLAVAPSGRIALLSYVSRPTSGREEALVGITPQGTLDTAWGSDGLLYLTQRQRAGRSVVAGDDELLVSGYFTQPGIFRVIETSDTVEVRNVAPRVTLRVLNQDRIQLEGQETVVEVTLTDPGNDFTSAYLDWNDGSPRVSLDLVNGTATYSHSYTLLGNRYVGANVRDDSSGSSSTAELVRVHGTAAFTHASFDPEQYQNIQVRANVPFINLNLRTLPAGSTLTNLTTGQVLGPDEMPLETETGYDLFTHYGTKSLSDGNWRLHIPKESLSLPQGALPPVADLNFDFFVLAGDANRDRKVDFSDFLILRGNFGRTDDPLFSEADFNYDGKCDFADFLILRSKFGVNLPPPSSDSLLAGGDDDESGSGASSVLS